MAQQQPIAQGAGDPRRGRNFSEGFNSLFNMMPNAGMVQFFMFLAQIIISPFAIVTETIVRKNMGERFFTFPNFIIGSWIVATFGLADVFSSGGAILLFFGWAYWILGLYHLLDQWWRTRTGNSTHSLMEGISRLEPISVLLLGFFNKLAEWSLRFLFTVFFRLSEEEKVEFEQLFPVFIDRHHFTLIITEPLFFITIGLISFTVSPALGSLLLVSTGASVFGSFITRQMRRHRLLNIRDSMIEAEFMRGGMSKDYKKMHVPETMRQTINDYAKEAAEDPEVMEQIKRTSPSIADAMAALNPKLQDIGKEEVELDKE